MIEREELSRLSRIARQIRRQNRVEQKYLRTRLREARLEVKRLIAQFREIDPDLERVILFGSLARNTIRGLQFDIDLAVRSEQLLKLVACGLRSSFQVDVVDLDRLPPSIRQAIEEHGEMIYAKKS